MTVTPIIKKFCGASLSSPERIKKVADIIASDYASHPRIVVVVSATSKKTDQLNDMVHGHCPTPEDHGECDVVLSTRDQISAALMAIELKHRSIPAQSFAGWQLPIRTTSTSSCAHITHINTQPLLDYMNQGGIPVVCGGQGINEHNRITTLGRGGSDITAVALASALKASCCQIFQDDVHGVHNADPSRLKNTQRYDTISYDDMAVLSQHGTNVLHPAAVQHAQKNNITIQVLSTWHPGAQGTHVRANVPAQRGMAVKSATHWILPHLCKDKIQAIHDVCHVYSIPTLIDWHISSSGLSFVTWQEHAHLLAPVIDHVPDIVDVITTIGIMPKELDTMLGQHTGRIRHCVKNEHWCMTIINPQDTPAVMHSIYDLVRQNPSDQKDRA